MRQIKKVAVFSIVILILTAGCTQKRTAPECTLKTIERLEEGAFPKWSANNVITFTKEVNNQFEVFVMNPDGTGITCLTCGKEALALCGNRGQSYWHPTGEYIVFTAENAVYPRKGIGTVARPGIGRNFNVWIMTADGEKFWQITDYPENWEQSRLDFPMTVPCCTGVRSIPWRSTLLENQKTLSHIQAVTGVKRA